MTSTPDWIQGYGVETDMSGDKSGKQAARERFWMPPGSEKVVIFLTPGDRSPTIWEHNYNTGSSWANWLTCLSPKPCPMCELALANDGKYARYKVQLFTVIDTSEWQDKAGVVHKNERKVLCAKKKTVEILARCHLSRIENGVSLRGAAFKVFRTKADKSPSVGEMFEFIRMVDLSSYDADELDYAAMFAPDPIKAANVAATLGRDMKAVATTPELSIKY